MPLPWPLKGILVNFRLLLFTILQNYGTMGLWLNMENYGTLDKTMVLYRELYNFDLRRKKMIDYKKLRNYSIIITSWIRMTFFKVWCYLIHNVHNVSFACLLFSFLTSQLLNTGIVCPSAYRQLCSTHTFKRFSTLKVFSLPLQN